MRQLALCALTASLSQAALAHGGHGASGMHWHATDVLGFVTIGALVAMVIWHLRK